MRPGRPSPAYAPTCRLRPSSLLCADAPHSRRDYITQPSIARDELPWITTQQSPSTLRGLNSTPLTSQSATQKAHAVAEADEQELLFEEEVLRERRPPRRAQRRQRPQPQPRLGAAQPHLDPPLRQRRHLQPHWFPPHQPQSGGRSRDQGDLGERLGR